ncbi:MAG: AMP-binding protein [Balneolaceae bacterium]
MFDPKSVNKEKSSIHDDHIFLTSKYKTYKYRHLYGFTNWLQKELAQRDITPSDKNPILIVADHSDELIFLISASFLMNLPLIILHPKSVNDDIGQILNFLKPCACFKGGGFHSNLLANIPILHINKQHINIPAQRPSSDHEYHQYGSIAGYFHTSGSTGSSKIVPVHFDQVLAAANASSTNIKPGKNKYWLLCLPLNHVGGINVIYRSLIYQSAIYTVDEFDPDQIRTLLNENRSFEAASMVPTMLTQLLEDSFFRVQFGFKGVLLGGGPISQDLIDRAITRGIPIVTSYGMTETCAQIAANPMLRSGGTYIPKTSVGPVFKPNEVEIRSENGTKLQYNESGLIWLRGPQLFRGYLDKVHSDRSFDSDGWFNTGDFGHLNRKGHLFIENRRTDLIITGGENVNPIEIESILDKYESIKESAVVGIPDKKWGQRIVAFIVANAENDPDVDAIRMDLKSKLRGYKIPKEFIRIDQLPKTTTLKVRKKKLVESYLNKE